jgi:hypothetical protein
MKPGSDTDLTIPPALAAEVQAAADDEHRPAAEIVRDTLEGYLENRRWLLREQDAQQARERGLPDNDLPLTSEHRQTMRAKIAQGVRSLRAGKGTDGEALFAKMDADFEELERQGRK